MTRDEAALGAIVVRLDKDGNRKPGLYRIREVGTRTVVAAVMPYLHKSFVLRLAVLRLATPVERKTP